MSTSSTSSTTSTTTTCPPRKELVAWLGTGVANFEGTVFVDHLGMIYDRMVLSFRNPTIN